MSTLDLYHRHAADGADPLFHKAAEFVRPLVPPLGAYDLRVANPAAFYATFTLGGLVDVGRRRGRAPSTARRSPACSPPVAPRRASPPVGYVSGISLGDGTFFGRRAGRAAACLAPSVPAA